MTRPEEIRASSDIAIIGMNGRFPGANDLAEFWRNLREGVESVTFFSDQELLDSGVPQAVLQDPHYVKAGAVVPGIEYFDAPFFGINPREAETMDPQQRLFLECAWHALEDAGYAPEGFDGAIGIYAGCGRSTYWDYINRFPDFLSKTTYLQVMLGNDKDYLTTHASYKLGLTGPSVCIQASCATSLVAVNQACQALRTSQCDMALAGGICIRVPAQVGYLYHEGGIFSPDGHCRVFDADAQGMLFGNGVGLVVLRRLADALKAGDPIRAVIKGAAVNNDGSSKGSYTAPSVEGQAAAIGAAFQAAGIHPETISYVEAHGTGTALGDPVEVAALARAFRQGTDKVGFCALGSVKTNFGHLDHAAGIAGLIKTVLALEHRQIPPSLHCQRPNPAIEFEQSPFYVNTTLADWQPTKGCRRAGVSGFSIGGTNVHVLLEEAPLPEKTGKSRPCHLLTVSARTSTALAVATENLANHLDQTPDLDLADVAYTGHVGRGSFAHRRFVLCKDRLEAVEALRSAPERITTGVAPAAAPSVAFLFSGQGTQYVYMALDLLRVEPVFREQVEACVDLLKPHLEVDLSRLLYPPAVQSEDAALQLRKTAYTQAALFTVEYALAKLMMSWGVRPAAMLGHSIGEYVAACLAGVFPLETALALVAERGRLMQSLPAGSMLAVNLPEHEVRPLLGRRLGLAAINDPSQCVVSGPNDAVDHLEALLLRRGKSCRRLQTSHAFHSPMMEPILKPYREFVKRFEFEEPKIPYISNVTGTWVSAAEVKDPAYWAAHIRQTVRFAEGLGCLLRGSNRLLLEVGPGQTLCSFVRRHPDKSPDHVVLSSLRSRQERKPDTEYLLQTLGHLWLAGVPVDWPGFYCHQRRRRLSLPGYPFERQRYWVDAPGSAGHPDAPPPKKPDVAEWFYLPSWLEEAAAPVPEAAEPPTPGQPWLVFQDDLGVGAHLVDRLEQSHRPVMVVRPGQEFAKTAAWTYEIDPHEPSHYQQLIGDLCAGDAVPGQVAHLWSLSALPEPWDFATAQHRGFYSLVYLSQALASHKVVDQVRLGVITNQVQRVADGERVCPGKATMLGACTVVSQEYPNIRWFSVDLAQFDGAPLAERSQTDQLIAEFHAEMSGTVLAYREGRRLRRSFQPLRVDRPLVSGPLLRRQGVYLITGGLGRIGLTLAKALASNLQARLVLVGRSKLPVREEWDDWLRAHGTDDPISRKIGALREIEEQGGRVLALGADVSCPEQMKGVLERTQAEFGDLHGVIHGAGSLAAEDFRALDQVDRASCDRHFRPKVRGALVLRDLLRGRKCDFCVLLSSLSSVLGGLGYLAYSSANAFLDAFVHEANQDSNCRWFSLNWDQWSFPEAPADGLAMVPGEGVETFLRFLGNPPANQLAVSTHDLSYRLRRWVERNGRGSEDADSAGLHARPELGTDYAGPSDPVEETLVKLFEETLGIRPIGIRDSFFELGGQSLLATDLVARIRSTFHIELPLRQFFEAPTVAELALVVCQALQEAANSSDPDSPAVPSTNGVPVGTAGRNGTQHADVGPDSPAVPHANRVPAPNGLVAHDTNGSAGPDSPAVLSMNGTPIQV